MEKKFEFLEQQSKSKEQSIIKSEINCKNLEK